VLTLNTVNSQYFPVGYFLEINKYPQNVFCLFVFCLFVFFSLQYIAVLMENNMLLSKFGCFFTAICYSVVIF